MNMKCALDKVHHHYSSSRTGVLFRKIIYFSSILMILGGSCQRNNNISPAVPAYRRTYTHLHYNLLDTVKIIRLIIETNE